LRISIGIIAAERSVELIRKAHGEMSRMCGITYLPYSSMRNLADIYERSAHLFDGVIFSGRFPYSYIVNHVGSILKPHAYFELTDRDYYKAFAGILYRFPGIRVSRILIDRPYSSVDFAGVFGGDVPMFFDPLGEDDLPSLEAAYGRAMKKSAELWRAKKIDLVLTRFTNLAEMLGASGIPFELLFPSEASMLDVCGSLFSMIQSRRLAGSMVASGIVSLADPDGGGGKNLQLLLENFNEKNGMPLVVRKSGGMFELTTSNGTLEDITHGYTDCVLTNRLHAELGEGVCVGWGIGADIVSSCQNAVRAFGESMRSARHHAYLVNDLGDLIGPMAGGRSVTMPRGFSAAAEEIGRRLGISAANLQKMISLHEHRGISSFSSADLAFYLNVTRRSAARILSRLAEHGWASVARHDHPNAKGRPYKIYAVNFGKLSSGAGE
jgi:predicted transcriptional regulator